MAVIAWGVQGWIGVALLSFVLLSFVLIVVPLGGIVAQFSIKRIIHDIHTQHPRRHVSSSWRGWPLRLTDSVDRLTAAHAE